MKSLLLSILLVAAATAQPAKPPVASLKFPALGQVKIPEVKTVTLPNGAKLYLLETHELPLISGTAIIRTGSLLDPADKVGLAEVTASMMRSGGTKAKTGDELDEQLENLAASVESGASENQATLSFSGLKENVDEIMAAFRDVLTQPEFREDKLDLLKNQFRSAIARRNDEAESIASREIERIVYGRNTVFGRIMEYENVDAIARQDLIACYSRYYFPANATFVIVGDFNTAEMEKKVEALFSGWTIQRPPPQAFPQVDKTQSKPGIYVAEKDNVEQTFFEIAHLGGKLSDKDNPSLEVALSILGSSFSGRLFNIIRTEKGYAYHIGGGWGAGYLNEKLFSISGSASLNRTTDTLEIVRREVERMGKDQVTDKELESAKARVLNSFVFNFDRPSKTLSRMVNYSYYGYPADFLTIYQKAIASVTKADVLAAAKRNLHPENLVYVVVGKTAEFGRPLADLNLPIQKIDLTIPEPRKASAGNNDIGSAAKAKQLLRNVQKAMGGTEALSAIKDMSWSLQMNMGGTALKSKNLFLAPNLFRQEQELPFGKVTVFADGASGWMKTPQGEQPLPPPFMTQLKGQTMKILPWLVMSDSVSLRTVTLIDDDTVEIAEPGNASFKMHVDPATGLPNKLTYTLAGMQGSVEIEEELLDYIDIGGGVKMYSKQNITQMGQKMSSVLGDFKINSGLTKETLGAKP